MNSSCTNSTNYQFAKPEKYNSIEHKFCIKDSIQTYELYYPLKVKKSLPVIFIFDPHGNGKNAISYFLEASELYGFLLIASNNSKNGVEKLDYILNTLINEVKSNYPIDSKRMYAAGFSGGGRVASTLAQIYPEIQGVISIGAGFSPMNNSRLFDIALIAGLEDFNYDESVYSFQQLKSAGWRTIGIYFNGGHQWPPKEMINTSVLWMQMNAMRKNLIPENETLIEQTIDSFKSNIKKNISSQQFIEAEWNCNTAIAFFENLSSTDYFSEKLKAIQESNEYAIEKQEYTEIAYLEKQLKQGYLDAFSSKSLQWWQNEIQTLNRSIEQEKNKTRKQMLKRMKGFLGIVCYSYSNKAAHQGDINSLKNFLAIYELVEPANADCYFFKALLFKKLNRKDESTAAFNKARELGFSDMQKAKLLLK